jgi:TrmH RNA methyltransferase
MKVYGFNASVAVLRRRGGEVERLFLLDERRAELGNHLRTLAARRRPYKIVGREELSRVAGSEHHEGVCLFVDDPPETTFAEIVSRALGPLVVLDGVGNPHNVGAILRIAAHFGARAVLAPKATTLSPATIRVAEGAAEVVPLVALADVARAMRDLRASGFRAVALDPRAGRSLLADDRPAQTAYVLGAERDGLSASVAGSCDYAVRIDGTGAVESLNVAAACAVILADHLRRHPETSTRAQE